MKNSITTALPRQSAILSRAAIPARWAAALGIVILLALVALTTYNAVTTDRFAADLAITRWLQNLEVNEALEEIVFYIIFEGLAGVVIMAAVMWLWFRSGHRVDAVVLMLAKLPNFINFPLRAVYGRPRPDEMTVNVIGSPAGQSFPSGHAVLVILLYGLLFYMLLRYSRSKWLIYAALAGIVLYIPFAGLYLVHYGRHWGSDVVGGYLYGLLYLVIAIRLFHLGRAWERRHPDTLTMATVRRLAGRLGVGGGGRLAR
ncbi:MAG: phosphatase PAP2 family protein [Chloroflexi bacterium]|nr:phosphatase PAP2 family protein [Chloroflexota bacterium]